MVLGDLAVVVSGLHVTFPGENGGLRTLHDINFSVPAQQFLCVLGPSGSGKSTLLRVLAGLVPPTAGSVSVRPSNPDSGLPDVGLVFQSANLMPWRSVLHNITLPLEMKGLPADEADARAHELIELIGLQGFENTWPRDLSGGMAQRVAIARALAHDPDLLLLDEPFGSLDALTRERMSDDLLRIWQARRKTVIMVTHSISEAVFLSDRVLVFTPRPARIELDMMVEFPRPRTDDLRYTPEFSQLSQHLRGAIRWSDPDLV